MAQGNVEVWLGTLLQMSRKSVHGVIRTAHTAVQDQGFNLLEFLSTFPAQVFRVTHALKKHLHLHVIISVIVQKRLYY